MLKLFVQRFVGIAFFFITLTAAGTVGYVVIEGWPIHDALYMTVITITAVGYSEINPLSDAGRDLSIVLIAGGVTALGIWFALITSFIVELDLKDVLRRRRMKAEIASMKDHIVLAGAGRTGRQIMEELLSMGQPFVVLERDHDRIEWIYERFPDAHLLPGDATIDHHLEQAGIKRARGLVTCLSHDTDNVFVCLSARHLCPELTIVSRALEDEAVDKLYRAGANHVVSTNLSGAIRMTSMLLRPDVVDFLDISTRASGLSLRFEQASVTPDSKVAGMSLAEAAIPSKTGLLVIALRKMGSGDPNFVFNPGADEKLDPGDEMIVFGEENQISSLRKHLAG